MEFVQIRLDKLNFASPLLRGREDKEKLEELKKSITACGILIPREKGDRYNFSQRLHD
ncbi:MAG: hypothetical protein WC947_00390 [Elusimicrobiota bacterium]